jgi:8-oxo-dGTP diphosphatase
MMLERMMFSSSLQNLLNGKGPNKEALGPKANGTDDFAALAVQNGVMTADDHAIPLLPVLAVGAVIWNHEDEIVLIRRGKAPRQDQWSIPGGHVEWGESLRDAVLREVREETGLSVEIAGLVDVVDLISRGESGEVMRHYVLVDFAARLLTGDLVAGSDAADARWVPISQLREYPLWSETRRIIEASARLLRNVSA